MQDEMLFQQDELRIRKVEASCLPSYKNLDGIWFYFLPAIAS
ncbi:MAG: hypothetical protein ACKE51_08285 [Methylococcaceae bacterium]